MPSIVSIGIATMDLYKTFGRMYPGGNELNIAFDVNELGGRAGFMGVFADDAAGRILENTLAERGVDVSRSHHEHGSSGYAIVEIIDGDRVFIDWNKQGVTDLYPFTFTDDEIEYIKSFDIACISWGARVSAESIRRLSSAGARICYDFSDSFDNEIIDAIAPFISVAFFSCSGLTEEETEMILRRATELGCRVAVATRGGEDAIAYNGEQFYRQPVCRVEAIDTMGAGDSYISAFLMNYLPSGDGDKIQKAMTAASEYAAVVVTREGALGFGFDVDPSKINEIINI
jgi:sugar/nucleoside kinase (ribokinase family)